MRNSSLEQVWKGIKFLGSLKSLNLSHSCGLTRTPNFSRLPSLKRLILKSCLSLVEFHESIGDLKMLLLFNLKGCKSLQKLPSEITMLKSLKKLILSDCSNLEGMPNNLKEMESLTVLHADGTTLNHLPSIPNNLSNFSFPTAKSLHSLFLSWLLAKKQPVSTSFFSLASLPCSLVSLNLANCNLSDDAIPRDLSNLSSLQYLSLSGNPISSLPTSIIGLTNLDSLILEGCKRIQSLPELPTSIQMFAKDCTSLERIGYLPNFSRSMHLGVLGCSKLVEIQGSFKLEPIRSTDMEMISKVGLFDLASTGNINVEMANGLTHTHRKSPLQVLCECDILTTFIPGSNIPNWFVYDNGSRISLEVLPLPDRKIQGLNICVVYKLRSDQQNIFGYDHYAKIRNETKGLEWTYSPALWGLPGANEDMLWISHWKLGIK
ncbi:disease resistance protein RPP2B-like [Cornus florida]|uniref:disease resistance protein RPP2B-like n=1 Tax=Cornus florida TaxID=4283 RepID=UPI00289ED075|nr:disease resistance protein RPP2B-like [Cornus florida]